MGQGARVRIPLLAKTRARAIPAAGHWLSDVGPVPETDPDDRPSPVFRYPHATVLFAKSLRSLGSDASFIPARASYSGESAETIGRALAGNAFSHFMCIRTVVSRPSRQHRL